MGHVFGNFDDKDDGYDGESHRKANPNEIDHTILEPNSVEKSLATFENLKRFKTEASQMLQHS